MNKKDIVITGATGFIGRSLVKKIVNIYSKEDLVCLIKNDAPKNELEGFNSIKKMGLKYILTDLKTGKGLPEFNTIPKLVIHMAANTDTAKSDHRVNYIGTFKLLKSLIHIGPPTHFIYFSTTAIMAGRMKCNKPFNEYSEPCPTNEYGRTKLHAEKYLIKMAKKLKFGLTIVRLPTVYGKGARKNSFFDYIEKLVKNKSIFCRLNWPGKTSLVYVEDVADAVVSLTKQRPHPGNPRIIILASDSPTMSEILKESHDAMSRTYKPLFIPKLIWRILAKSRNLIYKSEKIVPVRIYNLLWRASLVVDNVIYCKSINASLILPKWHPKILRNTIVGILK